MNWENIRKSFKAIHGQSYLMTAASGPTPKPVYEAYINHAKMLYNTGDLHWMKSVELLEETRDLFAQHLNASESKNIGFGPNTSHNMNILAGMLTSQPLKNILVAEEEFPSTSLPWLHWGYNVMFLPIETISNLTDFSPYDIVCISHIQYGTGFRAPINKIGTRVKEQNKLFIINATQSIGAFQIEVQACQADAVMGSLHKWFCAGYGCSFLYLSDHLLNTYSFPFAGWLSMENFESMNNKNIQVRKEASAVETGVPPFAVMAGVNAAMKWHTSIGTDNISNRILELSQYAQKTFEQKGLSIISTRDKKSKIEDSINSGTLLLNIDNSEALVEELMKKNVLVTSRSGALRISTHYFNTEEDINRLAFELQKRSHRE